MREQEDRLTLLSLNVAETTKDFAIQMKELYDRLHEYLVTPSTHTSSQTAHTVIVGGGIMGMLLAYYLSQEGGKITIIDRKLFGGAASGRNGGGVLALGRELNEIPFVRVSIDLWEQLSEEGIDTKFLRSGHVMVAMNELEREKLFKAQELYEFAGLKMTYLDPVEIGKLLPDLTSDNQGGLYSSIDAQSYPFTTISGLINRLKQKGVSFYSHTDVTGFQTKNDQIVSIQTNYGEITADIFVLCTGPWTEHVGRLLDLQLPIQPRRSQIMVSEILSRRRIHPFVSGNGLYLRQTHAGNALYGGGGSWEQSGFDVQNSMYAIHLLAERFVELFPAFKTNQLIRAFAGTVEITADHLPLFGGISAYSNLYISAGYNGHGYGMSAVMSKLLAKVIASRHFEQVFPEVIEQYIASFNPLRFSQDKSVVR